MRRWRRKRDLPEITRRALACSTLFILLASIPNCTKEGNFSERIETKSRHQMKCLSLSGQQQASVIFRDKRELKLTVDGGETWQVIPSPAGDALECATMIDTKRGWAVDHQGQVFTTDSAGASWTRISGIKDFIGSNQIEFVNEREGWIREFLSIWRTGDGGVTWRKTLSMVTPGVNGQPTGMFVIDANAVVSSGEQGQVLVTKDGGENWKIETPLPGTVYFDDVWFADQTHGWLAGYQVLIPGKSLRPLLLETIDGGAAWKNLAIDADLLPGSVWFEGNVGWLAGSRRIVNGQSIKLVGVLLRTEDGGGHWAEVQFGPEEPSFTDVRFADLTRGWLLGRDTLYRTEDGGKTWKGVLSSPPTQ